MSVCIDTAFTECSDVFLLAAIEMIGVSDWLLPARSGRSTRQAKSLRMSVQGSSGIDRYAEQIWANTHSDLSASYVI
ncbi:hypothetical protein, partial [Cupriavidus campinensis]